MKEEWTIHPELVEEVGKKMLSAHEFADLSLLFKMFADPTRLKILKGCNLYLIYLLVWHSKHFHQLIVHLLIH